MQMILQVSNLVKKFGGVTAVDKVNLAVTKGEVRAIIGPNGAGKTTLFNLITGILKADSGKIFFKGKDITKLPSYKRVKIGIGRSFQTINIFPNLTVRKNIELAAQAFHKKTFGPLEIISRRNIAEYVEKVVEKFGLIRELDLDIKAGSLTYINQRKLDILLALALNPEILLLDEPTAGMDVKESHQLMNLIRYISKAEGKTIIVIEHDIKFVMSIAERISVMDRGKIIAEGTPKEISENSNVKKAYLGEESIG